MFIRRLLAPALASALLMLAGCSTLITAYLVSQLLDEKAPKRTWTGVVRDTTGDPVGGLEVEVRGQIEGDTNIMKFTDTTDVDGSYLIKFRWNKEVQYDVHVTHEGVILASADYGTIELGDRVSDFIIQGAVNVELSGIVRGPNGTPLEGVVVVAASAADLDSTPVPLLSTDGKTQYYETNDSGVYTLTGTIARYGVVCAYHPDHGFAYAYGEDTDLNGSIALNITMGNTGTYDVSVRVVDGDNKPIDSQVLDPSRQFRLRLGTPFNLGPSVDKVVGENGLFPGLVGEPSNTHPENVIITVQATGLDGIAEQHRQAAGGSYFLSLLNVGNDDPATALVQGENPLTLFEDTLVTVRVN